MPAKPSPPPIPKTQPVIAKPSTGIQPYQKLNSFFLPKINPLQVSELILPEGKYSLGADSTVPFVSFQGGGGSSKTFTWGELIEIPPGQTCKVKNESYMRGDIQINSGHDYCTRPARISVPFSIKEICSEPDEPEEAEWGGEFPADTRLARRCYVAGNLLTLTEIGQIMVYGIAKKHSFPANQDNSFSFDCEPPYVSYKTAHNVLPNTLVTMFPLGYRSSLSDNNSMPMGLTDQANFLIVNEDFDNTFQTSQFMYIIEY